MRLFSAQKKSGAAFPSGLEILESMVIPTFVLDRDRRVVLWNKALEDLTGIQASAVMNTQDHWRGFYDAARPCLADLLFEGTAADTKNLYAAVQPAGQTGGKARRAENWCTMPAIGKRRYLILDASAIMDKKGQLIAVVETLRDATAEQEAKTALQTERDEQAKQVADQVGNACASLGGALAALAEGNMTFRIGIKLPGAIDQLRENFNTAIERLQSVLRQTTGAAGTIREGVDDIATTAEDLSRRTDQQAAALAETAEALRQIMNTVKQTADGATHARSVVATTKADVERSGQVVRDAVDTMGGVAQSSAKITQIIGVIDEIAFQTNLLSLNAGVEAARAGDAGRGFAVVASEVRALAQRSAEAAREIKGLISESASHVERGVHLVGLTGEALVRIVSSVTDISDAVATITASALEQASGLKEINAAVMQMDQVTQQNAGIVQQAASVSQDLVRETAELDRIMGRFQIGEGSGQRKDQRGGPVPRRVAAR